ncbi:unnamed protein product [Lathyrus sativus]|nr:unnamed protein product [Lathyrus sativus]
MEVRFLMLSYTACYWCLPSCLKRYTDPSFFKMESASSVRAIVQVHRERRIRKVKKKGARLRDGETPNVVPTHSKLHQLLLEERIENGYSNPARLVKLKKRQLNGPAVEAKSGKSYMEKFLETPSPDPKMIYETSIFPLSVKPAPDEHVVLYCCHKQVLQLLYFTAVMNMLF